MKEHPINFAVAIPLANEEQDLPVFVASLTTALDNIGSGTVYFIIDRASRDNTLSLCQALSQQDKRFVTLYAPENKNVVDAYRRGLRTAYENGHDFIIEMDGGLSHDPASLPLFLAALTQQYDCAFGSRNIAGGSNTDSPWKRRFLSNIGTWLAKLFLGAHLKDMTSGYQGFRRPIVKKMLDYSFRSTAHFYQTEVRYLLRHYPQLEIPIQYSSPSPRVSGKSLMNCLQVLSYYTLRKFSFRSIAL